MNDVKLITQEVNIKDEEGKVLFSAPLMDLYYMIALEAKEDESTSKKQKMEKAALEINTTYNTNITWGQVISILEYIGPMVEDVKKN